MNRTLWTGRSGRSSRRMVAPLAALVLVGALLVVGSAPAGAATLTNVSWSVSNNQIGATNVSYTYSFKTATTGVIKTITFAVSGSGLAGTPTIVRAYGIGAGTVARAGQTITYTVTSAVSVSAGIPIYIEFGGNTNSATTGPYTTTVTTQTSVPATIDTATSPSVTLAANNTAITANVAKSLTATLNTTAFEADLDPSLPVLADQSFPVTLTVQTNANSGYTVAVNDLATGLQSTSTGNPTIAKVSAGKASSVAWPGAPTWGYTLSATGATADAAFSASKFAGYVPGGETVATRSGPTGGTTDTITITNRFAIDYSVATGTYTDTVTYTVTPNYT